MSKLSQPEPGGGPASQTERPSAVTPVQTAGAGPDHGHSASFHRLAGSRYIVWSEAAQRMHEAASARESSAELLARVVPEDRADFKRQIARLLKSAEPLMLRYRILCARGELRELEARARCIRGTNNEPLVITGTVIDVTARRAANERLARSERTLSQSLVRFRQLADAMPLIVSIADPDGTVEYLNRTFERYTALPSSGLGASWQAVVHADDMARLLTQFDKGMTSGDSVATEMRIRRADGEYRWHQGQIVPIRDERGTILKWYGTAFEVHDQRLTAEHARLLARRLQTTLDSITDAFFIFDADWRVTYANERARDAFLEGGDLPSSRTLWDQFPAIVGTQFEREYRRALDEGVAVHFEAEYQPLSTWVEVHAYPSDEGLAVYVRDITERKQIEQEVQFLAMYDPLTRLPNRRLWRDRLQHALAVAQRSARKGAILFIDLDDFKTLNDTLGHDLGDAMLQQVAARLRQCVRSSDTVARLGGDEFVVLLEELAVETERAALEAETIARKVLQRLGEAYKLGSHERVRTASIGLALLGFPEDSVEELMKRADLAMYQAKAGGRQTLRFFDPAMQAIALARGELESGLRQALALGELTLAYQAQVDSSGTIRGAEALLRWHPASGAPVPPDRFIPVAEETGLILPIGRFVLAEACQQLARWQAMPATAHLTLSINVSARQFRDEDFVATVIEELDAAGAPADRLKLELTETLLLDDVAATSARMAQLHALGVGFSLDDFGTGYSSLAYLQQLSFDELKIDKRFIAEVTSNANDAAIVRAVIAMADTLGLAVIAEGVETVAARRYLEQQGCGAYQGYLFSRPVPLAAFEALLGAPLGGEGVEI